MRIAKVPVIVPKSQREIDTLIKALDLLRRTTLENNEDSDGDERQVIQELLFAAESASALFTTARLEKE
jgi:hypothetical protein